MSGAWPFENPLRSRGSSIPKAPKREKAKETAEAEKEKAALARKDARRATILTSAKGVLEDPNVLRKTLLGK